MLRRIFDNIEEIILFCTVSALLLLVTIQIVARLLGNPPSWTEEVSRQLLAWTVFMGAAAGVKLEEHVGTTFLMDTLPLKGRVAARFIANSLFFTFAVLMAYNGAVWVNTLRTSGQRSTNFETPVFLIALSIPLAFTLSSFYLLRFLYRDLRQLSGRAPLAETRPTGVEGEGI